MSDKRMIINAGREKNERGLRLILDEDMEKLILGDSLKEFFVVN